MRRLSLLIPLSLALLVAAGAIAATPRASLKITYWPHGPDAESFTWTLRCGAVVGGTHPARRLACNALAKHATDLGPATRPCTFLPTLRSPRAKVTGTWAGRRVERTFRLGCRGWSDLRVVLTGTRT